MSRKRRKNARNAPIERFIWREGDVRIIKDPRKKHKEQETVRPDDAQRVDSEGHGHRKDA